MTNRTASIISGMAGTAVGAGSVVLIRPLAELSTPTGILLAGVIGGASGLALRKVLQMTGRNGAKE